MIVAAEEHLARLGAGGERALCIYAHRGDGLRQGILTRLGYTKREGSEYQRRRSLQAPIPTVSLPTGYAVRALGDVQELPARSRLSWDAFHADDPDGYDGDWSWYRNVQRAPLYRRDLDLVVVAPNDELAAFCTAWFDDVTRVGAFEPVGTASAHRRRGLGKALLCEGLRRLQGLGATTVHVGSYDDPAHALYESVGFTEYDLSDPWRKEW
jgi:ribosomal protein S18 acetylase RimI-like enzyme